MAPAAVEWNTPEASLVNAPYCGAANRNSSRPAARQVMTEVNSHNSWLVSSTDRQHRPIITASITSIPKVNDCCRETEGKADQLVERTAQAVYKAIGKIPRMARVSRGSAANRTTL